MDDTIITSYCLCDDFFLKAIHHRDDPQRRLSTAEVMTIPLVAATFFGGHIEKTRRFLYEYGYMKKMISKSHLKTAACMPSSPHSGRCSSSSVGPSLQEAEQPRISDIRGGLLAGGGVRQRPKIRRCRIYPLEEEEEGTPRKKSLRGYIPSKRRYFFFYGLRVHLVVSGAAEREPVEFSLAAGSEADVAVLKELELDLSEGSIILADKDYTDYDSRRTS